MDERPLVVTDDEDLLEDLLRLAAAAGVELTCARRPSSRAQWRAASVVVIDGRQLSTAVAAGWPRRSGVYAVVTAEPDSTFWELCVALGIERTMTLPGEDDLLIEVLSSARDLGPDNGRAIAVIGARGGAGASVLAAAVAVTAAKAGSPVILADCDPWGSGQDILLGVEGRRGLRWPDLMASAGRVGTAALHRALPAVADLSTSGRRQVDSNLGRLSVLCHDPQRLGPVPAAVVDVVISSCRRAGELVVLDLPRDPGEAADRALELADLIVMVAPADVRSCYAGRRLLDRIRAAGPLTGLVVRGPAPGGLGADDLAMGLNLPLITSMRLQAKLAKDIEMGLPPAFDGTGPLPVAARKVLGWVGVEPGRNSSLEGGAAAGPGRRSVRRAGTPEMDEQPLGKVS